jgi:hypothetical protein
MRAILNCLNNTGKTYSDSLVYNESNQHYVSAPVSLNDADGGGDTGWTFEVTAAFDGRTSVSGTQTFYDPEVHGEGWTTNTGTGQATYAGLDNAKTYSIIVTADHGGVGSDRICDVTVGGTTLPVNAYSGAPTEDHQVTFTGVSPSANSIAVDFDSGTSYIVAFEIIEDVAPPRSITNTDGDNIVEAGQAGVIISGNGFGVVSSVTLGGETCVVNSNTATQIDIDIPLHINAPYDTNLDLVVTDETGSLTLPNVQVTANANWTVVEITALPDEAATESVIEYAKTDTDLGNFVAEVGDSFAYENQAGLTIDSLGVPTIEPPATVSTTLKFFDASAVQWTNVTTVNLTDGGFTAIQLLSRLIDLNLWTAGSNGVVRGNDKTGVL